MRYNGLNYVTGGIFMLYQIIGAVVGGAIGYAAYRFIGCSSGACPITSNPFVSILVGALLGRDAARGAIAVTR